MFFHGLLATGGAQLVFAGGDVFPGHQVTLAFAFQMIDRFVVRNAINPSGKLPTQIKFVNVFVSLDENILQDVFRLTAVARQAINVDEKFALITLEQIAINFSIFFLGHFQQLRVAHVLLVFKIGFFAIKSFVANEKNFIFILLPGI